MGAESVAVRVQSTGPISQALKATLGYNLLFNDTADPAVIDVWGPHRLFRVPPWVARGLCVAVKDPSTGVRPGPAPLMGQLRAPLSAFWACFPLSVVTRDAWLISPAQSNRSFGTETLF